MAFSTVEKKQNPSQNADAAASWIVRHWQQVGLALAALAVTVALGVFVVYNLSKLRNRAWEQLSYAQAMASQGKKNESLQAVEQLLGSTRSGAVAAQAQMLKADILLFDGKNADAVAAYNEALRQATTPELKALALNSLAFALEQDKKLDEAEARYAQFDKEFPEHFLRPKVLESLGRLQMARQKWPEAQSTFEKLVTYHPTTVWAQNAQQYLAQIKASSSPKPGR